VSTWGYNYRVVLPKQLEEEGSHTYMVVKMGREERHEKGGWKVGPTWNEMGVTLMAKNRMLEEGWEVLGDFYGGILLRRPEK